MSVAIFYSARRKQPLTNDEKSLVDQITQKHSVDHEIEQYLQSGQGLNWESFHWYKAPWEPENVLEGSTSLPDNTEDAMWIGVQKWCAALSEIRNAIPGLEWTVKVDDHEIQWDPVTQLYDPSK